MENNEMEMNMKTEITDTELLSLLNSQTEDDLKKECVIGDNFSQLKTFKMALKKLLSFTKNEKNFMDIIKNKTCVRCELYTNKDDGDSMVHLDFLFSNDADYRKALNTKLQNEEFSHISKTSRA